MLWRSVHTFQGRVKHPENLGKPLPELVAPGNGQKILPPGQHENGVENAWRMGREPDEVIAPRPIGASKPVLDGSLFDCREPRDGFDGRTVPAVRFLQSSRHGRRKPFRIGVW